jgi:hypothetical protein
MIVVIPFLSSFDSWAGRGLAGGYDWIVLLRSDRFQKSEDCDYQRYVQKM